MSLYGALFSGVSGLTAQSSAMGAISDNITNVSTIGYKGTKVNFRTLVTKQTSVTFYSAGGVQSAPRQNTDVQGLLQASTSQTDLSISGKGFFVVNKAAVPTISNEYLYSRTGSFIQDDQGFLKNAGGYYLQGWPTDASGTVQPANDSLSVANQNIISGDYLESINLNRVGGTAAATSTVGIGANLPANASAYDATLASPQTQQGYQKTDVQFFDTLGNANTMSIEYKKTSSANQWDMRIVPPTGTTHLVVYNADPVKDIYDSVGQLEFTARPHSGTSAHVAQVDTITLGGVFEAGDIFNATVNGTLYSTVAITDTATTATNLAALINANAAVSASAVGSVITVTAAKGTPFSNVVTTTETGGGAADTQTIVQATPTPNVTSTTTAGATVVVQGVTFEFWDQTAQGAYTGANTLVNSGSNTSTADDVADLLAAIIASTPLTSSEAALKTGTTTTILFEPNATTDIVIGGLNGLTTLTGTTGTVVTKQALATSTFTIPNVDTDNVTAGKRALVFQADGLPSTFNATEISVHGFTSGASDMNNTDLNADGVTDVKRMTLDLGTPTEANGFTQFGASFTPIFITQNGSRFGTFSGVTVSVDGLVTALFDNGETRTVYKIPIATFVNPNGLESQSGNTWNSTDASGDYTLRVADNGPSGQVIQSTLEASTVDIGEEFTNMIVVQRAYSAAAKIISTADAMLEELLRIKR